MPTRLSHPRPTAPTLARHLLVALLALALLATACSDAHNQAQRDFADTGTDPNVLTLLAPPGLTPVLTALDQAFLLVRPNTSVIFVNQIQDSTGKRGTTVAKETNTQIVQAGAAPSLWIDSPSMLRPFADDPRAVGKIVPFGVEPMVMVVAAGNPAKVTGLDAFAAGGAAAGRCLATAACGKLGAVWLAAAHVKPVYAGKFRDAPALLAAISHGVVQVGLVQALDLPPGTPGLTTVPVAAPPSPTTTYRMLCLSQDPTAAQFERWVATSPAAHAVLSTYGLLPGAGPAAA